jgi:hypothetical protein
VQPAKKLDGGKLLVAPSCEDAKMPVADQKAHHAAEKDEERAAEGAR